MQCVLTLRATLTVVEFECVITFEVFDVNRETPQCKVVDNSVCGCYAPQLSGMNSDYTPVPNYNHFINLIQGFVYKYELQILQDPCNFREGGVIFLKKIQLLSLL